MNMGEIKKIEIDGEIIYLKKSFGFWGVVAPHKNDDGKTNWFNLLTGGKKNLILLIFYMFLLLIFYLGINQLIAQYKIAADNPCDYCYQCYEKNIYGNYNNSFIVEVNHDDQEQRSNLLLHP